MSFRRSILEGLGGFRNGVGAVGAALTKCEDTEFSIRVYHRWRRGLLIHEPRAKVHHRVPASRARWCYFRSRCYGEGIAKFQVSRLMGIRDGLGPELGFISRTLPLGVARGLAEAVTHADLASLARAGAIVAGLAFTMAGFLIAVISAQFAIPRHTLNGSVVTPELAERGPKQGLQATSSVLKE